ncbi:MAG: hypothetical protein QG654_167 [Patescibacteria group bacterium]|nr:hypothetical protein [Patescibacteria group bacterium]
MIRYVLFSFFVSVLSTASAQQVVTIEGLSGESIADRISQYVEAVSTAGKVTTIEPDKGTVVLPVMNYTGEENGCLGFVIERKSTSLCKSTKLLVIETDCGEGPILSDTKEKWFEIYISLGQNCGPLPCIRTGERYSESGQDIPESGDKDKESLTNRMDRYLSVLEQISRR